MYSHFDYIFCISVSNEKAMHNVVSKFDSYNEDHPFYISYYGAAPSLLNMNFSAKVVFIKHGGELRNTSPGLVDYLRRIVKACGIDHSVSCLNS